MSTNQPPLSILIDAKMEVGCYTCSRRNECAILATFGLRAARLEKTQAGKRVTVFDEGRHPIGWLCIHHEPETDICEKRTSCV